MVADTRRRPTHGVENRATTGRDPMIAAGIGFFVPINGQRDNKAWNGIRLA
jgi:hypothetical protein